MTYASIEFCIFVLIGLALYYIVPLKYRWMILLAGSVAFYFVFYRSGWSIVLITILITYGEGILICYLREKYPNDNRNLKKMILALSLVSVLLLWFTIKKVRVASAIVIPLGISFYSLQMVSYLADIYKGKINAQKNMAKYALFILFFPQIVQGPMPRYDFLAQQLYKGHSFDERKFVKGMQLIIWGIYLKFMIADKAAVVVNTVFAYPNKYGGCYILVAGIMYSIELYTDFLACVTISQGVAGLFGITLADNFRRPYFATSIKEFWRRWHISLSEWLRDYIYIPLGGSRKGHIMKYVNLAVTFTVSGIWHGAGYKFVFWGLLHAGYQIAGEITAPMKKRIYRLFALSEQSGTRKWMQRIGVFFEVTLAWIIFRADSLRTGLYMVKSLFMVHNPWVLFDDSLLNLGLGGKEWCVLILSTAFLYYVSDRQEKGYCIRDIILQKSLYARWALYIAAILCIMIFGTYGFGYQAQEFIYGGF